MKRSDWGTNEKTATLSTPKRVEQVKRNRIVNNITKFLLNMKQKMIYLALTLFVLSAASVNAQVNIGSDDDPHKGAVLDLSQTENLGLLLPQVFLTNVSDWQLDGNTKKEGMLIYNTNDDVPNGNGKDIYVWTRNGWKPIGPVMLKRFELDKDLLFLEPGGQTGTITAQNFTGSDDKPFDDVTVTWSIAAGDIPDDVSISPVDNTFTVISGSTAGGSFTVRATAGGITQDCVVTIDECAGVMDVEGHAYYAAQFGDAGCWMTQNLRSTGTLQGSTWKSITKGTNSSNAYSSYYYFPNATVDTLNHPEYGLLYTWPAANIGTSAAESSDAFSGTVSTRQGICPPGWHLPSYYEWLQLEEVIALSAANEYSTTGPTTWETSFITTIDRFRGAHGQKMKSTTVVNDLTPNGTSKSRNDGGFDVLLMGSMQAGGVTAFGSYAYFWTANSASSGIAWRFAFFRSNDGAEFMQAYKYQLRSVRCKKN
ncbi:MAG: fibrobacter succinogenes major paralogous domain-containing protein [Dysgonamonadaceae bacterium]|nr:fibrobacter succinogenes major paralogous domain-containing protein [Dysgonamonadaceae bacterium]